VPLQLAYAVNVTPSLCLIATVYPVITEPPSAGATQLILTLVLLKFVVVGGAGTLGAVGRTAPLPEVDVDEIPTAFVANTVA
jgi:hypothetical protein